MIAYVSLGGNLGDTRETFTRALAGIDALPGVRIEAVSAVYQTEPQGDANQPWYSNQAARLRCDEGVTPEELLRALLRLEQTLGRARDPNRRFGPRVVDLDLLLFGEAICASQELTLPHPRLAERAFVLVPLLELDPDLRLPVHAGPSGGKALHALLANLPCRVEGIYIYQKQENAMSIKSPSKTLGVLSGMGPAAGAEFMRLLAAKAPAKCDQEHPIVYMLSDAQIPDRTAGINGTGEDPTERIRKGLLTVAGWGVDFLAVPCNTAHVFIDRFRSTLPVPLIHIVEETVAACRRGSPKGSWLLATEGTCKSGLYQNCAQKMGYTYRTVSDDVQKEVTRALVLVKANKMRESGECMRNVVEKLWKIEELNIATACTELPLAYDASGLPAEKSVSSLGALSDACLKAVYGDEYKL